MSLTEDFDFLKEKIDVLLSLYQRLENDNNNLIEELEQERQNSVVVMEENKKLRNSIGKSNEITEQVKSKIENLIYMLKNTKLVSYSNIIDAEIHKKNFEEENSIIFYKE